MSSKASELIKTLGVFKKPTRFDEGLGALLPAAYRKFYKEWKETEPTAVHYIPQEGKWRRDEITGEVHPIQNTPIPERYPPPYDSHMWGGEAVIQGFFRRNKRARRVPHFWVPSLKRSVVYSEILDKHISVVLTDRTIHLINTHYGLDHYLLKTPACDLKSLLPLQLKRKVLQELEKGCPSLADNPEKQNEILDRYGQYLTAYTPEEIEWYGYNFVDACKKLQTILDDQNKPVPLKHVYRSQLIEQLKAAKIKEVSGETLQLAENTSWLQKINPFGKKHET